MPSLGKLEKVKNIIISVSIVRKIKFVKPYRQVLYTKQYKDSQHRKYIYVWY